MRAGERTQAGARIRVFVPNLLSWDGSAPVTGGLERFARQLLRLLRSLGWQPEVWQYAAADWLKEWEGFPVHGCGLSAIALEAGFQQLHQGGADVPILYASLAFHPARYQPGSLVMSHGVWWDGAGVPAEQIRAAFRWAEQALAQARLVVSCDYNFLNVVRSWQPDLAGKIRVIPNFVDTDAFVPGDAGSQVVILYPRRLDERRGLQLFLQAAAALLPRFPQVSFLLSVDDNHPAETEKLRRWLADQPWREQVELVTASMEAMPEVYRRAQIVVLPSLYSEGTSFSCLEAMASGCAVVASDVGGLTNLILSGYNGLLLPPRASALVEALEQLIREPDLRARLGRRARQVAEEAFSLQRWEDQWRRVITQVYGRPLDRGPQHGA